MNFPHFKKFTLLEEPKEVISKYCFDRLFGIPECKYQCKKCKTMENYERLTIELLGNGTPREKYEYVKWMLNMHELYTKTKLSLEDDMEYFGNTNSRHTQALRTYNILNGTLEYIPNYEDLRREFYKVMEYTQPFGNEYHDDLFNWMWSKIRKQSELKCDTPINKEETKCEDFEPFGWSPLQITTYAINCPKEDKYFVEVTNMIERYADTKVYNELEAPAEEFDNKVLKTLKSMTLSMSAHPDCFKKEDGTCSEFYDLVSIAEKVIEGTLDTRHG